MGGYYVSTDGNMAYWVSDTLGSFTVSCKVSDGKAYDELSIVINVITAY